MSIRLLACAMLAPLLASCGGGDSSTPPPPPPAPPSLATFATQDTTPGALQMAADSSGNVYMLTLDKGIAIPRPAHLLKISPAGVVANVAITLVEPSAVTADASGNVYVFDAGSCGTAACTLPATVVQKIAPNGAMTPIAVTHSSDATIPIFFDLSPSIPGLAVDAGGNIFLANTDQGTILKLAPDGDLTTYAGHPVPGNRTEQDGVGANAAFAGPAGIAFDRDGNLYVADSRGETIRRVAPDRVVSTVAGTPNLLGGHDGPTATATFAIPTDVIVDSTGALYVADGGNALIRKIAGGNVTTVAGMNAQRGYAPGPLPGMIDEIFGMTLVGRDLYFAISNESTARTLTAPLVVVVIRNVP